MSKSREQKQARKQARAQKQTEMSANDYRPTGKSKYARKQARKQRPGLPLWILTQKSEPVTLTAEERDAERGDMERAWEREYGADWRTK